MKTQSESAKSIRQSWVKAAWQLGAVTVIVAAGLVCYKSYIDKKIKVTKLLQASTQLRQFADKSNLEKARAMLLPVTSDERIQAMLAQTLGELVFWFDAQEHLKELQQTVESLDVANSQIDETYTAKAYLSLIQGKPQEVENLIALRVKQKNAPADFYLLMSLSRLRQSDPAAAEVLAREGMQISRHDVWLPIARGDALLAQGNPFAAGDSYRLALHINAMHPLAAMRILQADKMLKNGAVMQGQVASH